MEILAKYLNNLEQHNLGNWNSSTMKISLLSFILTTKGSNYIEVNFFFYIETIV